MGRDDDLLEATLSAPPLTSPLGRGALARAALFVAVASTSCDHNGEGSDIGPPRDAWAPDTNVETTDAGIHAACDCGETAPDAFRSPPDADVDARVDDASWSGDANLSQDASTDI